MFNNNEISKRGERVEIVCPTCWGSLKKGLLWIGGKDYLECPDCGGPSGKHPGVFRMWEKAVTPPKVFVVPGFTHSPSARIAVPMKIKE